MYMNATYMHTDPLPSGYFKTWTVDSGLDHGLDCGLKY